MHDTYLLRNNDMKFEMVQSMVTHTNFTFRSKFQMLSRSICNGRHGGKVCKHSPVNIVNAYNQCELTIQCDIPHKNCFLETVKLIQMLLTKKLNVINMQIKHTYQLVSIHKYFVPIYLYVEPMCMPITTRLLPK